jgi:predicted signal transduction protein with EAL and GGDEF domain
VSLSDLKCSAGFRQAVGIVKPDIFIPVAEEMGMIGALSRPVLIRHCPMAHWDQT